MEKNAGRTIERVIGSVRLEVVLGRVEGRESDGDLYVCGPLYFIDGHSVTVEDFRAVCDMLALDR